VKETITGTTPGSGAIPYEKDLGEWLDHIENYYTEPPAAELTDDGRARTRYFGLFDADTVTEEQLLQLEAAVVEYLAAPNALAAKRIYTAKIGQHRAFGLRLFRAMVERGESYPTAKTGTAERVVTLGSGEGALAVPLNVSVPDSYSSTVSGRRRVPLLISLVPTWTNIRTEPLVWSRVAEHPQPSQLLANFLCGGGGKWNCVGILFMITRNMQMGAHRRFFNFSYVIIGNIGPGDFNLRLNFFPFFFQKGPQPALLVVVHSPQTAKNQSKSQGSSEQQKFGTDTQVLHALPHCPYASNGCRRL
jgi:hypothetical protein